MKCGTTFKWWSSWLWWPGVMDCILWEIWTWLAHSIFSSSLHSLHSCTCFYCTTIRVHSHWYESSPGTCIRVPVNTGMRVFQRWPFTFTQVLYEYELPVNFTRTSSFWAGRVFIQPVRCKQNKICLNLIYTRPLRIFYVINYITVNYSLVGVCD